MSSLLSPVGSSSGGATELEEGRTTGEESCEDFSGVLSSLLAGLSEGLGVGREQGPGDGTGVGVRVSSANKFSEGVWLREVLQLESASDVFRACA